MIKSRYTFTFETPSKRFFIMNYLTGAIDEVLPEEREELEKRLEKNEWSDYHLKDYFLERGYLFPSVEDEQEYIHEKYIEFLEEYENTPVQIIFSTTYACNFSCVYCFQESYKENSKIITPEVTNAFFQYISIQFANEKIKPYITLFGGEPLLGGERYKKNLLYFLEKAKEYDYEITIVTNGYELVNYVLDFKRIGVRIREIQVSIDGSPEQHNKRRPTASGKPTFERVALGVSEALKSGYRVNLRMIVDKENLPTLVKLAEYAEEAGWLNYSDSFFETTIGRNYELHTCQPKASLYNRVELWKDFIDLAEKYPIMKKFHKPHFHGIRYLAENGTLPMPIFDGCPAGKKEWAFDLYGNIYGCTASVGVEKYKLGNIFENTKLVKDSVRLQSYSPEAIDAEVKFINTSHKPEMYHQAVLLKDSQEEQRLKWQTRDVLSIPECRTCPVSLSCGGGCGVLAANRTGEILSPDCRPVKEIVSMAIDYYRIGLEET
ncbi:MAG: radical SAM protein [Leptospiraceae bacterium]|nr:radical SAM protein [Leptospiraceae bacterium]MDW7976071.1 radical SAM protein [Leptospiraceae bacterium]